jgi:hypothetical protein
MFLLTKSIKRKGQSMKKVTVSIMAMFLGLITPCLGLPASPKIWLAFNGSWDNHVVTHTPETVTSVNIVKQENSSILKVSFSGGRLSFQADAGQNAQAAFDICINDVVVANALNFDGPLGFRNQYPFLMTVPENLKSGAYTISVKVYTTANPGLEGGILTYTTTLGRTPNTYKAQLIVEEWPVDNPAGVLPAWDLLLK